MELADVKIAVGIDVQLLKGLVQFLYDREVIPKNISQGGLVLTLEAPAIEVDNPSGAGEGPVLALRVTGMFALSGNPSPFDAKLALEPFVRAGTAGAAPVAALRAGDVISITPASAQAVFGVVATAFLNDVLANLDLPLFDPLIAQVEAAFFPDDPPARSTWAADFFLGKESELEHRDIGFPPAPWTWRESTGCAGRLRCFRPRSSASTSPLSAPAAPTRGTCCLWNAAPAAWMSWSATCALFSAFCQCHLLSRTSRH